MKRTGQSFLSFLLIIIFNPFLTAQPERVTYLADNSWQVPVKLIEVSHMDAELRIDPFDTLVYGNVSFLFKPMPNTLDSFDFYSPDLTFESVSLEGMDSRYVVRDNKLVVYPGSPLEKAKEYIVKMKYTARPLYDLFHIGWSEPAIRDNKQIWAHRPFHWLPYVDARLTVDMKVTFEKPYKVFSNGVRMSVTDNDDGTWTWHYKMFRDHPFFSTALVIGQYDFLQDTTPGGVPLELWYYPWNADHAEPTYRHTAEMFTFFEQEFGFAYPYELYREAPVEDYLYGAMETTTSTVFGDYLAVDERGWDGRNYVNVNSHELAHQWFGNCLSHMRNRDVWLTESFATYYAKMFEKHIFGDDYYEGVRKQELEDVMEAAKSDGYGVGHGRGGRARWYPKGSLVLDMLRDILGDEGFKASIKHYLETNAFSVVETGEFLAAIREATGQSMEWFFEQWIYRGGEPTYEVSWHEQPTGKNGMQTVVDVRQVHQRDELIGLFRMPVTIDVYYDNGTFDRVRPWIEDEWEQVSIPNPEDRKVAFVLFDPGRRIIKNVKFQKSFGELSAQLLQAPNVIDRYDALLAMADLAPGIKEDILLKAYKKETFHLVKGEILRQLGPAKVKGWFQDADPLVRRAGILSADVLPDGMQKDFESLLNDVSYINVEQVLDLLCRSFPVNVPRYLEMTRNETGWRGMNIRMKWLEIAIGQGQREYLAELVGYAGPNFEFETRINAFNLLKKLNYLDNQAARNLVDGYLYWNYKVSNAARDVLKYFYAQNSAKERIGLVLAGGAFDPDQVSKVREILGD